MDLSSIDHPEEYFRFVYFHNQSKQFYEYMNDYQSIPLVSLEQAVIPLLKSIPRIYQMVELVKEKCHSLKTSSDLSTNELASIMLYTLEWTPKISSFYYILNRALSSNDPNQLKDWYSYIKLFSTSLEKLPRSSYRIFFRIIPQNLQSEYSKDDRLIWYDYISCSSSLDSFNQLPNYKTNSSTDQTIFIIYSEQAIDISEYSFYPLKDTLVLLPNQEYRVISSRTCNSNQSRITLKSIPRQCIPRLVINEDTYPSIYRFKKQLNRYEKYSEISLRHQNLTDNHMGPLVEHILKKQACQWLSLENNEITSHGLSILTQGLPNHSSLESLYLSQNHITNSGIKSLAKILNNRLDYLTFLSLNHNHIGNAGACALAKALKKNTILMDLWLSYNDIGNEGGEAIAKVLSLNNTTLIQLYLHGNELIDDDCVDSFIELVNFNRNLSTIWLYDCGITIEGKTRLERTSKAREDLKLDV